MLISISGEFVYYVNCKYSGLDGRFTVEHEVNSEEVGWAHEN